MMQADQNEIENLLATLDRISNSTQFGSKWFKACQHPEVNLASLFVAVPFNFEMIKQNASDLLRSDHAPFWHQNIPALMITDGANFRNPFYHTRGDIITTIDFDFLEKITKATILSCL